VTKPPCLFCGGKRNPIFCVVLALSFWLRNGIMLFFSRCSGSIGPTYVSLNREKSQDRSQRQQAEKSRRSQRQTKKERHQQTHKTNTGGGERFGGLFWRRRDAVWFCWVTGFGFFVGPIEIGLSPLQFKATFHCLSRNPSWVTGYSHT